MTEVIFLLLKEMNIENFKSIKTMQMEIANLNILVGPNNSGKTSVLQALALLKQSTDQLTFEGPLVNLGDFEDAVHKHDRRKVIKFGFSVLPRRGRGLALKGARRRGFSFSISIKPDRQAKPSIYSFLLAANNTVVVDFQRGRGKSMGATFDDISFSTNGFLPRADSGRVDQIDEYERICNTIIREFSNFLYYLSAGRGIFERSEVADKRYSHRPRDVGLLGQNTIPVLAHIRDVRRYRKIMDKIHFWVEKFGLTQTVAMIVEGVEKPGYSLKVTNKLMGVESNILDVGFGLNQLFPVIVQCFYAPKGSLIMVEQPEAHLHPKSQADVADFLIDVVNFGNRVMVETHSEHLLLRLQRRVAEKKIDPKYIKVYYFKQTSEETTKTDMRMDDKGYFIEPIPPGFFEEGFQEAVAHLKASHPKGDKIEQ